MYRDGLDPKRAVIVDIPSALSRLASQRPVFHSEADFQLALAWELQAQYPELHPRLEYRPFPGESAALDIRLASPDGTLAIELKYLTKALDLTVTGERFVLKNQGAYDISAYDCCKDLERLERFVSAGVADAGCLVVLTNDSLYWRPPARPGAGYDAFRIFHGRTVSGALEWGDRAGPGTRRGRENVLELSGRYNLEWQDYSRLETTKNGRFRALVADVSAHSSFVE